MMGYALRDEYLGPMAIGGRGALIPFNTPRNVQQVFQHLLWTF